MDKNIRELLTKQIFSAIIERMLMKAMKKAMSEKLDMTQIYAAALPIKNKRNLLAVYKDYVQLVRNLEYVVKQYRPNHLSGYQLLRTYGDDITENPWMVEDMSKEEKAAYLDFVNNKPMSENLPYCFVSIDHTSSSFKQEGKGIISTPDNYTAYSHNQSLPARIERYVAAYPKEIGLKETEFLIAGRWKLQYLLETNGQSLKEAFNDDIMEQRFSCMLDILTLLPEKSSYDEQELYEAQTEAQASALINPFENVLLSSLTTLSEESNKIIKRLLELRIGEGYIFQAEKEGLISSASSFQDYQNIRHLVHHQWDTLDGLGRFNGVETVKNISVRRRYLDSYCRMCDKPLVERVKSYIKVAKDMSTLVSMLNPNLLIRGENESNSKFINRAKQYAKAHPEEKIMLEAGYDFGSDKKEALIKNAAKVLPEAEIIDICGMDIENFLERISVYLYRKNYLEIFQQIEYKMSQHCLFYGRNIPPSGVLAYYKNCKMMSAETAERWGQYKQLRNDLSHQYLNEELISRLEKTFPQFMKDTFLLEDKIDEQTPVVSLLHDNIYRAYHKNGKIVDIDYTNRKIVNIEYLNKEKSQSGSKSEEYRSKTNKETTGAQKIYMEEYRNGVSIGVNKTDIISCRLPNGTTIDLRKKSMIYPDGSRLYFNSDEHICLTIKGGIKLLTDKNLHIENYINNGKSVSVTKNENMKFPNGHGIIIDKRGNWEKEEFVGAKGKAVKVMLESEEEKIALKMDDGTTIAVSKAGMSITHNQQILTYATRKKFAESYNPSISADLLKKKKGKEK